MQVYLFLEPFPARNLKANVTSTSITVQWKYDTQNSGKSPVIMYELWYMISGGSPALKQMTWSDIVNYTGPPIILSYTFQNILKPHTNYSIGIRSHNLYNTSIDGKKIVVKTDSTGITIISNILRSSPLHVFCKIVILNSLLKIKKTPCDGVFF